MVSRSFEGKRHHAHNMVFAQQCAMDYRSQSMLLDTSRMMPSLTASCMLVWHKFLSWNALQYWGPDLGKTSRQLKHEEVPDVESLPSGHQQQGLFPFA